MEKIFLASLLFAATLASAREVDINNITLSDIVTAARNSQTLAERQFRDRYIRIEGVVVATGVSRFLTPYVDLSDRRGGQVIVRCVLPYGGLTRGVGALSDFSVGENVVMTGRVQHVFSNSENNYPGITNGVLLKDSHRVER